MYEACCLKAQTLFLHQCIFMVQCVCTPLPFALSLSYITGDIFILSSSRDLTPAHQPPRWDILTASSQASSTAGAFNPWEQSRKEEREEVKGWSWIFHGCSAGLHGDDLQRARSFKVSRGKRLGAHKQSKGEHYLFTSLIYKWQTIWRKAGGNTWAHGSLVSKHSCP